ncbi:uncharacterized protein DNG_03766 [Cephalotrichum gorgonifer]|uniref:NACHT domain-containing protein n=1 Tax=Cephalotrichum gorgonifer TaxID=2041049 RepID=A0AAE8SUA3_9PEZI|nr:uncharacterized protein DNG_03766 [Cephalotrichum gorgonifer]
MSQDSSGADARLTAIRDSTRGVIFFGTPHSGSDMANWGELLRRIAGIFAVTNSTLLAALNPDSDNGQLEELKWSSFSTIPDNHRDICRFSGPTDPKYTDFVKELQRFLSEIDVEDQLGPREGGMAGLSVQKLQWLNSLYTCPYVDRKDLNPPRVEGTCKWFTSHPQFRNWKESNAAGLLWVSADPGCGKSVLAKYLVDEELRSTNTRTTCYFFFKDGFDDQKSSTIALSCILRQLFKQSPGSFSDRILATLEADGSVEGGRKKPPMSFRDLWDLFIAAATTHKGSEIVCILDALDECEDSGCQQLLDALVRFYLGTAPRTPAVKFLLTSRPYSHIRAGLRELERKVPTIHLSGENEERVGEIAREIDIVITKRVEGMRQLGKKEQAVLREELLRVENRTYLWVHLIFPEIEKGSLLSQGKIRSEVRKIPRSVDEAYDRILSKSRDTKLAEKLLHIVVAATRPLNLQEMALALAIQPTHRSWGDLEQELVPEEQFPQEARQLCGLFVVVVDKKIYLLHQTAREFLVPSLLSGPSIPPTLSTAAPRWKFAFHPRVSNRILAEILIARMGIA